MIIAFEFDGTIVENSYPAIGKDISFSFYVLGQLQARGHQIVLRTRRTGSALQEAVDYCKKRGFVFDLIDTGAAVNSGKEKIADGKAGIINADIFIDYENDLNKMQWLDFFWKLHPEEYSYVQLRSRKRKRSFFRKIFRHLLQ